MKRGQKDTIVALAVGGGLVAIIAAIEARRDRAGAPVITRGRWATIVGDMPEYPGAQIVAEMSAMPGAGRTPHEELELVRTVMRVLAEYERRAIAEKLANAKANANANQGAPS